MKQHIKQRWVENLRSGKYKQAFEKLRDDNKTMCVIGMLVETRQQITHKSIWKTIHNTYYLDDDVDYRRWSGLTEQEFYKLMKYNDVHRKSFNWLAYYIERYIPGG